MSTGRNAPARDTHQPARERRLWTFPGGIHPSEEKTLSNGTPIRDAGLPERLVLPLHQAAGAAAEVQVVPGERVLRGQLLAAPDGFVSAGLHAPTSGTVRAVEARPVPHPSGLPDLCIVLEVDGDDRAADPRPVEDWASRTPAELVRHVREAGIAGLGGAGFPTAVKLAGGAGGNLHTLVLNGVECEPYITADDALMRERAPQIVTGARMLMHIAGTREALLAVEDNKPEAAAALRSAVDSAGDDRLQVVVVPTKYPSGGEKQLVQILTGEEVPSGGLPSDLGVLCQNVGTAAALQRALQLGEPLISRVTTVTGRAVRAPGNFDVRLGTPFSFLLEQAGLDPEALARLVMGGSMMGVAVGDASVPVVKTTNCLLAATREEFPEPAPEQPCIRCGACETACPAGLLPQQLYWYARARDLDAARSQDIGDCIECGACAWVCPSAIPLVQYYRHTKSAIRQQDEDSRRAERSRERFEHHQARVEAEQVEREARRRARAEAARKKAEARAAAAEAPAVEAPATEGASADGASGSDEAARTRRAARATVVEAALARAGEVPRPATYVPASAEAQPVEPEPERSRDPAVQARDRIASIRARVESARETLSEAEAAGDAARAAKLQAKIRGMEQKLETLGAEATDALPVKEAGAAVTGEPSAAPTKPAAAPRAATPTARSEALAARIEQTRSTLEEVMTSGDAARAGKLEAKIAGMEGKLAALRAEAGTTDEAGSS